MASERDPCQCGLHKQLGPRRLEAQRRHACYRQLAFTILGSSAPKTDLGLARALADHARYLEPGGSLVRLSDFRAALSLLAK